MLKIGDNAPQFALKDQTNKLHTLSQYKGKWVILYFYPKDNTPGCTTEACSFRDNWESLKSRAIIFGVSTDSIESHTKFGKKYNLPFPILSDNDKKVVNDYQVWAPKKFMGKEFLGTLRVTYIIDPKGTIAKIYPKVKPDTHVAEIKTDLNLLQS